MIFTDKTLKSLNKETNKNGFIRDITTKRIERTIYGKKVLKSKIIGVINGKFITDTGELTVLHKIIKWNNKF